MRSASGGPRVLLRRLREVMAEQVSAQERLDKIKVELDQCWDLLRQRDARREFGEDPDAAKVRPASVVERYEQ